MKVGSLVICPKGAINTSGNPNAISLPASNQIIYTVRLIRKLIGSNRVGVCLEEITNPINEFGLEYTYTYECFKEVQPPLDLTELIEETLLQTA